MTQRNHSSPPQSKETTDPLTNRNRDSWHECEVAAREIRHCIESMIRLIRTGKFEATPYLMENLAASVLAVERGAREMVRANDPGAAPDTTQDTAQARDARSRMS